MLSYSVKYTGAAVVGTISVQVSNDYSQNQDGSVKNAGTWNDLPLSTTISISGSSGNGFIDIDAQAGYALRLVYNRTSGTGAMEAVATGKVS